MQSEGQVDGFENPTVHSRVDREISLKWVNVGDGQGHQPEQPLHRKPRAVGISRVQDTLAGNTAPSVAGGDPQ